MPASLANLYQRWLWRGSRQGLIAHAAIAVLSTAAWAGLAYWLWQSLGRPPAMTPDHWGGVTRPWGLGATAAVALPLAAWLTSTALAGLIALRSGARPSSEKAPLEPWLRADALCNLAAFALNLGLILAWPRLPDPFLALGALAVAFWLVKAVLLSSVWWRGLARTEHGPGAPGRRVQWGLCVAVLAICASLTPWIDQAVSTASDEVGYILRAQSLVKYGTTDPGQAVSQKDQREFYWARWSKVLSHRGKDMKTKLYPHLLYPAYALGGRLGVLIFNALIMALAAMQLHAWLRESGAGAAPAAQAVGLCLSSAPVLLMSQLGYPDIPGLLLFLVGLRLVRGVAKRPLWCLLAVAAIAVVLFLLKTRLGIYGAGLGLAAGWELLRSKLGPGAALWAALAGVVVLPIAVIWVFATHQYAIPWISVAWWRPLWTFFGGLLLGQNYGAFFAAPIFLLALAGLPAALRRLRPSAMHALIAMAVPLALLYYTNWVAWHGGFATPARHLVVLLPAAGLFMVPALSALARPFKRLLIWVPACLGFMVLLADLVMPHLRYAGPLGMNRLVRQAEQLLGLDLHHLLPSVFMPSRATAVWATALILLAAGLAVYIYRWQARPARAPSAGRPLREGVVLALALLALAAGLVGAARACPPRRLQAELMIARQATAWAPTNPLYMRGMVLTSGGSLSGSLAFPGGPARLVLVGLAGRPGRLEVSLDGKPAGSAAFASDPRARAAIQGWEVTRGHFQNGRTAVGVALGRVPRGRHIVTLRWKSCDGRDCWLLADYLDLRVAK